MSLEIREQKWKDNYESGRCAKCDSSIIAATIDSEHIKIFVCEDCLNELKKEIDQCLELASKRCEKCVFFRGDKWDWVHYQGYCIKKKIGVPYDNRCDDFIKRAMEMKFNEGNDG